uniref:Uncharacterized protein n=1 Tax=viral metagenome TaxID=1070528 RepID=A0A6C0E3D9_9ZZZZ
MDSEIIDISSINFDNLDDSPSTTSNTNTSGLRSSNFGGGIELLMNDKKKDLHAPSSDIDIEDLNNLENELNDLANNDVPSSLPRDFNSGMFGTKFNYDDKPSVRFDEAPSSNIGVSTAETADDRKTWDGYGKFNNIPINPDKQVSSQPQLTKEELLREKFKYLRKLEALEKKGVELTKKYTMESSLAEMQGEYEMIMEEKTKQNSIKFQGNMMMAIINGIEFLNNRFDPFDINLDGWGEQLNENINDYDDIFGELYEKYKSKASMAPELKLLFQLGGSAVMVHMTNTMFKSAMPGMDDILRQNPDLMRSFQSAAVNSMNQTSPGFSGFMSGLMNPDETAIPKGGRGPPAPMATQGPNAVPPPQGRGGNNIYANRPDITMARSNFVDDGIDIKENNYIQQAERSRRPATRPDMKGPSDISDILSGLKTKTINIQESSPQTNDSSTISINDLKDIQSDGNVPKRSKRRPKSDKNTVSLDI